ncbi:MAG: Gfo/Idh/MocA family protein [Bryobacteraceae bacterium]
MTISRRTLLTSAAASAALEAQVQSSVNARKLKLAFIGTGHRAWAHMQVLKAIPDFEIVALADPTPEFLDRAATIAGAGARTYSSYQEMLAKEKDLDGVIVVTPTFLHAEATIAALSNGRNVLCEKPMAFTVEQANSMNAAAEQAHKILQIGMQMRYDPLYEKMAETVKNGEIGRLQYVAGNLFRGDWNPNSWKYTDPKTGVATNWRFLTRTAGSSLMEDGIHELDVLNWMIGSRVTRIYATGGNNVLKNRETIDHAGLLIDYENGIKIAFEFCIFAPAAGPATRRMTLIGDGGNLQSEIGKLTVRKKGAPAQDVQVSRQIPREAGAAQMGSAQDIGTYRQYLAFANSIRTGARPFCNGDTAKDVLKISLLAEKSIRERKIVSWTDLPA